MKKKSLSGIYWIWVSVVVFLLDYYSKSLALHTLKEYQPVVITPFFNFTLAYNKGAAFSFLNGASGWQTWFFGTLAVIVSVGILIWMFRNTFKQYWINIALALIIGGALGNLFDRIYYGCVTDFIQVHAGHLYWPVFNLADSAVCVGAVMLILDAFFKKKKTR